MSEHVLDWLGAYRDGELHGDRLRGVEAHLRLCAACQAELAALEALAARLQSLPPVPARTPPEQFVAQVRLRLPPRSAPVPGRQRLRKTVGLWVPLGVLALWALGQAVLWVGGLALGAAALRGPVPIVLPPLPGLGAVSMLVALVQPAGWGGWLLLLALNVGLTAVAAVLMWSCLASWWAARETNLASSGALAG